MAKYRDPAPEPEFIRVAALEDVPPGGMRCVQVDGRDVALMNLDGTFYAVDNNCPHNGGPLAEGRFDADAGRVICPWHSWTWDVRSGRAITPPVSYSTPTYAVRIEGRDILVSRYPR